MQVSSQPQKSTVNLISLSLLSLPSIHLFLLYFWQLETFVLSTPTPNVISLLLHLVALLNYIIA